MTTLVADLADQGVNPAEAPYNCWIEVDTESRRATIVWVEDLRFHADNRRLPLADDGWLKPEAYDELSAELESILQRHVGYGTHAYASPDFGGDEPHVAFEVDTDYAEGETYGGWLERIGWPIVAALINSTDPGTFNYPYLFSAIEEV